MRVIPRSLSISGLVGPIPGGPRGAIAWARGVGAEAVQLDGMMPGLRARELDRSARRDLAATLRREGLSLSGIDLWIPPGHFADPAHASRAIDAVSAAAELAGELDTLLGPGLARGRVVSIEMPEEPVAGAAEQLVRVGARMDVAIADHAWPRTDTSLALGLDPAAMLLRGANPASEAARLTLASARLDDLSPQGRVEAGTGSLDVLAYQAALSVGGFGGWLVADLRGLRDQERVARRLLAGAR